MTADTSQEACLSTLSNDDTYSSTKKEAGSFWIGKFKMANSISSCKLKSSAMNESRLADVKVYIGTTLCGSTPS